MHVCNSDKRMSFLFVRTSLLLILFLQILIAFASHTLRRSQILEFFIGQGSSWFIMRIIILQLRMKQYWDCCWRKTILTHTHIEEDQDALARSLFALSHRWSVPQWLFSKLNVFCDKLQRLSSSIVVSFYSRSHIWEWWVQFQLFHNTYAHMRLKLGNPYVLFTLLNQSNIMLWMGNGNAGHSNSQQNTKQNFSIHSNGAHPNEDEPIVVHAANKRWLATGVGDICQAQVFRDFCTLEQKVGLSFSVCLFPFSSSSYRCREYTRAFEWNRVIFVCEFFFLERDTLHKVLSGPMREH